MGDLLDNEQVAARLKQLRRSMDIPTQTAMAVRLGVDFDRYNLAERGLGLSKEVAILICQKFAGVTLDWLYFGRPEGLPLEWLKRLDEAPVAPAGRFKRRPRKSGAA